MDVRGREGGLPPSTATGGETRRARRWRLAAQSLSLCLFLWLLGRTAFPLLWTVLPVDSFLRLDPLLSTGLPLAARAWIPALLPGLGVLALCLLAGRVFCGYICPLGATLDVWGWLLKKSGLHSRALAYPTPNWLPRTKYLLLAALLTAAALGVNLLFWASPMALVTRFYTVILFPLLALPGQEALQLAQSQLTWGAASGLAYAEWPARHYDALWGTFALLALLLALDIWRPRFWCRYLCPAGALMSLFSLRPLWSAEWRCGAPCEHCRRSCPTPVPSLPSRRAFLAATGMGAAGAALHLTELGNGVATGKGLSSPPLRPPGAVPERAFLARCARCGQCMRACPTNALQPAWGPGQGGAAGLLAPVFTPRRGPCEPQCQVCGQVCPSAALTPLPLEQKQWAKVGTALIVPGRCLAWSQDKRCMVCQEVCPYGAIDLLRQEGHTAPVPVVRAQRCFGCGYCEFHCPVRVPAVVVEPFHALRLPGAEYASEARAQGLELTPGRHGAVEEMELAPGDLPPGFTE